MIEHGYDGKRGYYLVLKNKAVVKKYPYDKNDEEDRKKALQKARNRDLEEPRIIV